MTSEIVLFCRKRQDKLQPVAKVVTKEAAVAKEQERERRREEARRRAEERRIKRELRKNNPIKGWKHSGQLCKVIAT